ncbi:MAG: 4-deoxy-4-formamido-L-arabinose-phosphoundecaprenol deformylase [Rhodocyclaceae bacterium]|jgi:peptidoglycan/xylan/chitin deacetylase (PgdA/CDA1 family)|nr:4-deoxy-4-formamido-L-arabinose-phosphoundecaprenol deformylase [Rhodocyclaceae bacterium]
MKLALKIDAATFRGTLVGVPRLVEALRAAGAQASFFFNLGPDRSGSILGRLLAESRQGASLIERHGLATALYGTLLPGPDVGQRCAEILRGVRDAGFETGVLAWCRADWQRRAARADAGWTERQMRRAVDRYQRILGTAPTAHAAAGWQLNPHALRLTQRLGFGFASDTRGSHPFVPVWNAEVVLCPQLPTTLPTLDELLLQEDCNLDNVHERLLALTAEPPSTGHVFTLRAELEGQKLLPVLGRLLQGWQAQGYALVSLGGLFESIDASRLPRHELLRGELPGCRGSLMLQGPEFLAAA